MKFRIAVALALLLAASPASAQILVPGDHPDLATAVSAAAPGSTIIVTTSLLQAPVVVDKPLTILGDPVANVGTEDLCHGTPPPAILLAGPGSGTVVLSQLNLVQCFDAPQMGELLSGGGFSEVHVYNSTILTAYTGLSGLGSGSPAISVSVPFLLLSGTAVLGGRDDVNICWLGGFPLFLPALQAYPGVEAPGSRVAVLDSVVVGGSHNSQCCELCTCPADLSKIAGPGGAGIVAAEVLVANSTVVGGSGATVYADFDICGTTPDGLDFVSPDVEALPALIAGSGPLHLGSPWTLNYFAPGQSAALLFSVGVTAPMQVPGLGWSFLSSLLQFLGPLPTGVMGSVTIPVPADMYLVGLEVNFQILDSSAGLSRPVLELLLP